MNDMDMTMTYCAPPGSRGAFLRLTLHNHGATTLPVAFGVLGRVESRHVHASGTTRQADSRTFAVGGFV